MKTADDILKAEEEFARYHDRLRSELEMANFHFSVVKHISNVAKDYLQELNQSPAFWWLTRNAHMYSVLTRLNNFFTRNKREKDAHLHMPSFLDFIEENTEIFSAEAFERRLRTAGRYDEMAAEFKSGITKEKVQQDRQKLRDLDLSGLRAQRNRIFSHIKKKDIAQGVDIAKKYPIRTEQVAKIIDALDDILNEYSVAFDFVTHEKGLAIEYGINYILDAIRFKLQS